MVQIEKDPTKILVYSWIVKTLRNTSGAVLTPLGYYTDCGPTGLGQYNSLREYLWPSYCLLCVSYINTTGCVYKGGWQLTYCWVNNSSKQLLLSVSRPRAGSVGL